MKIYLIGFMGAGKSTVGKLLSKSLNGTFIDLDQLIEQENGKKISDIFKEDGETVFRKIEAECLKKTDAQIIATGGGILYFDETAEWLRGNGVIIYLHAPFEELYSRIKGDRSRPVAAKPYKDLKSLFAKRDGVYKRTAHHQVSVSNRLPEETVKDIISRLG
ncbi:shikimate kinase [Jeotgalibacillus haloalkalitolerans]|uniref:Shikimate kinase n=1 Tax=Jeotgalibacillus haloalkalitolerans TaxID=3104292 RepID=A0ABU5KLK2_9BACL|nr:shikimate kinase [Jeotgalibacillus sp. HH7-29]MDZ5712149.1 shikimate kinase [Jeotgalibacillus sp. HH7-29]